MKKQTESKSTYASFKLMLDVSIDLGRISLNDALEKAGNMKEVDVFPGLKDMDFNDGSIEVTGVFHV